MKPLFNPIALAISLSVSIVVAMFLMIIGLANHQQTKTEEITEQQYYEQSLQYLEDIRNSNDDILKALNK